MGNVNPYQFLESRDRDTCPIGLSLKRKYCADKPCAGNRNEGHELPASSKYLTCYPPALL